MRIFIPYVRGPASCGVLIDAFLPGGVSIQLKKKGLQRIFSFSLQPRLCLLKRTRRAVSFAWTRPFCLSENTRFVTYCLSTVCIQSHYYGFQGGVYEWTF